MAQNVMFEHGGKYYEALIWAVDGRWFITFTGSDGGIAEAKTTLRQERYSEEEALERAIERFRRSY